MTRVEAIEAEVEKLAPDEFSELREWILERDEERWDRQLERDASTGKLETLFEGALEAHRRGESHEL
jgi:hypothetical protein